MRVKKYLALTLAALFAATMPTGCPWDIEDDEASENPGDEESGESEKPSLSEIFREYGTVSDDGITLTITTSMLDSDFRIALNNALTIKKSFLATVSNPFLLAHFMAAPA